jgi:hypothetical protein
LNGEGVVAEPELIPNPVTTGREYAGNARSSKINAGRGKKGVKVV